MGGAGAIQSKRALGALHEPKWVKTTLIVVVLCCVGFCIVLPLVLVIAQAFRDGWAVVQAALRDEYTLSAAKLTLTVAAYSVVCTGVFGVAAAWLIAKYRFRGKNALLTLIDLPFAVSPVIAGFVYILMFGRGSMFEPLLQQWDIKIVFATPGIVLATLFVTLPFVVRELVPLMQAQGVQEEEAAVSLGAGGWRIFWRVTLPNIKWALLYGLILCNARAMGEFGAVSVVSGHIRGQTNTLPLHIEILYSEIKFVEAFAVSMLLVLLAVCTLIAKHIVEGWKQ